MLECEVHRAGFWEKKMYSGEDDQQAGGYSRPDSESSVSSFVCEFGRVDGL